MVFGGRPIQAKWSADPLGETRVLGWKTGKLAIIRLQRRYSPDRMLRLLLDPAMIRRWHADPVRLPAPMGRGACAHGNSATLHGPLDRHGRGHLPHGVASNRVIGCRACNPTWFGWSSARSRSRLGTSGFGNACARVSAPGRAGREQRQPDHALAASHRHAVDLGAGWRRDQLVVGGLFPRRSQHAGRGA
jgi:hypothetical protein